MLKTALNLKLVFIGIVLRRHEGLHLLEAIQTDSTEKERFHRSAQGVHKEINLLVWGELVVVSRNLVRLQRAMYGLLEITGELSVFAEYTKDATEFAEVGFNIFLLTVRAGLRLMGVLIGHREGTSTNWTMG